MSTRVIVRLALVLCLSTLLLMPAATTNAQVITGYLTFETGRDGETIALPGVAFSTDTGDSWVYGDVRTHHYNAPYPQSCEDRPTNIATEVCEYTVGENMFASVGLLAEESLISFTKGTATFVAANLSTSTDLLLLAEDDKGKPIATTLVRPNAGSGESGYVELQAPAGSAISRLRIRGDAGLWLLDNLATDAPGVPDQRPRVNAYPAQLSLALRASPNVAVAPDDTLTLTIRVANHGRGMAKDATIRLPLSGLPVTVLDASFSRAGAWVTALDADALTIRTGGLGPDGDSLIATLKLRVQRNAAIGTSFATQLALRWSDAVSGGEIRSNLLSLNVADISASTAYYALTVEKGSYSSAIFAPGEPVGVWYNTPDGKAVTLDTIRANARGEIAFTLDTSGLPAGTYSVVTYGHWTELTATAPFTQP